MTRVLRAAAVLVTSAAAACNGDSGVRTPSTRTASTGSAAASLPAGQQCLPGNICERWAGCALVVAAPPHWQVLAADELPAGELVVVKNLCAGATPCLAASGIPKGAACPDLTTPVLVSPPAYRCVWDGAVCSKVASAAP